MYQTYVDVGMIEEINRALREEKLPFEVHTYSGCAACGLRLEWDDETEREKALSVIGSILKKHFLVLVENETDQHMLYVNSRFDLFNQS
jgi:hypothetical protein